MGNLVYSSVTTLITLLCICACSSSKRTTKAPHVEKTTKIYEVLSEDITFFNPIDSFNLAGTYTTPQGLEDFPTAVLISGSGPQNRNSEIFGHTPFARIADYLTSAGIGILRYDDRGVGKSKGHFSSATSQDFAKDALSAVRYLSIEKKNKTIGLIGHSEGGMIAQIVAAKNPSISFVVSLAGPGIPIKELMLLQNEIALKGMGFTDTEITSYLDFTRNAYDLIDTETEKEALYDPLKSITHEYYETLPDSTQQQLAPSKEALYFQLAMGYFSPWFRYFINYDPAENLQKITCPVLALNGALDVQVTADENLNGIKTNLSAGACTKMQLVKIDSLNHLFQKAKTGNTDEYQTIKEAFNQEPLEIMKDWILSLE